MEEDVVTFFQTEAKKQSRSFNNLINLLLRKLLTKKEVNNND